MGHLKESSKYYDPPTSWVPDDGCHGQQSERNLACYSTFSQLSLHSTVHALLLHVVRTLFIVIQGENDI